MLKKYFQVILTLLLIGFSLLEAKSQSEKERDIYDSITYHYYMQGNWDSVIDIGKEALYKGYDFYYLRMRLGLAYDYQANFRIAEKQYSKALKLVPNDVNAAYYQYFAAINGGRKGVAFSNYQHFNFEQKKSINPNKDSNQDFLYEKHQNIIPKKIKVKALELLSFSYGYAFTGNKTNMDNIYPSSSGELFSTGYVRNKQSYLNLTMKGNLSPMVQWDFAYNNHVIDGLSILQMRNEKPEWKPTNVKQNEIFGGLGFLFGNGMSLKTTAHYLGFKGNATEYSLDTIIYVISESRDTILDEESTFNKVNYSFSESDYVLGLSLNHKLGMFDFSAFATYGQISEVNPLQIGGEITILPKGNYSLYVSNRLLYYSDELDNRFIYKVSAGSALSKKWNIDASATFGNLQYTNEPNSAIVYNWSEKTTFKGDIILSYLIAPKVYLSLKYQLTQKQSKYSSYVANGIENSLIYPGFSYITYGETEDYYKFNQHFLIASLSWYLN